VRRIRGRLSYANVMATAAVFLALGGTAAAFTLGKNSVRSPNIVDGQVKTADLATGAVTGPKIGAGAVGGGRIHNGAVGAGKIASDAVGSNQIGPGAVGDSEIDDGALSVEKWGLVRVPDSSVLNSISPKTLPIDCPAKTVLVGGGGGVQDAGGDFGSSTDEVVLSYDGPLPGSDSTSFYLRAYEAASSPNAWKIQGYAICGNSG
jgi:hypothetical protein